MAKIETGRDLKEARMYFNMTQKEAAKYFGIARSTYAIWETKYLNKKLPKKKYKMEFDGIEYWLPRGFNEKKEKSFPGWKQIKWLFKVLFFMRK